MGDQCVICAHCEFYKKALKEKEEEIEILKCQLDKLINYFLTNKSTVGLENLGCFKNDAKYAKERINEIKIPESENVSEKVDISSILGLHKTEETKAFKLQNAETQTLTSDIYCEGCSVAVVNGQNCQVSNSSSVSRVDNICSEDYVYDENSKMYYSCSTGYYYDDKKCLLFEPKTGTYYKYNYAKQEYELVSENISSNTESEFLGTAFVDRVNSLSIEDKDSQCTPKERSAGKLDDLSTEIATDPSDKKDFVDDENEVLEKSQENEVLSGLTSDWQPPEGSKVTISDLVKEVANQHSGMSDYVYDENSNMYFSPSTGYYYDAVRKLLFEPSSGTYYLHDTDKQTYEFYYQVENYNKSEHVSVCDDVQSDKRKSRQKYRKAYWKKKLELNKNPPKIFLKEPDDKDSTFDEEFSSPEDGEIFSSDTDSEMSYPVKMSESSCIRAIVESSEKLKIGTLLLITCTGGILGREKSNAVCIPDTNVSKLHAKITYNNDGWKYFIEDMGSQNGTYINEKRLSEPKVKSEPHVLNHGDKLSLGSCKLLVHIHTGFETCDECEPGQVLAALASEETKDAVYKTKEEREKERRQELRRLKKKYGLESMGYVEEKSAVAIGYKDKAEIRRQTVGSENPFEKTEEASVHNMMPGSNIGYQILKKMGWKEGEKLGISDSGILEPLQFQPWPSKAGLGASGKWSVVPPVAEDRRRKKWVQAQERYFKLS